MGDVDQLWPVGGPADLPALYGYPDDLVTPYVRANFVASLDGAVTMAGRAEGLSDPADQQVFALQRTVCDVILVGAGTVRAEGYRGVRPHEIDAALRARLGLAAVPVIAVVTRSCWLTPEHPLVTDTLVPPIVVTVADAPAMARATLTAAGVPVLLAGTGTVDVADALRQLGERGLRRVLCEGGPALFTDLVEAERLDELCLTLSPHLVAGPASRIAHGVLEKALRLRLASALHHEDTLLLRYLAAHPSRDRRRGGGA